MEAADTDGRDEEDAIVLAAATSCGRRVELLHLADGSFAISCNGKREAVYALGAFNLESCIKSYLAVLKSCREYPLDADPAEAVA